MGRGITAVEARALLRLDRELSTATARLERARGARNAAILAVVNCGVPQAAVADVLGTSRQHIQALVRKTNRQRANAAGSNSHTTRERVGE